MAACMSTAGKITAQNVQPSQCTAYVLLKPSEIPTGFIPLGIAEGAQLAVATLSLWAVAFGFRSLRLTLNI